MGRMTPVIKVLIIINVLMFVGTILSEDLFRSLFSLYYFENPAFKFWQPITHMFMHGGIMHIFFNMFALFMFGTPLEQRWGSNKFLFFYFSAGLGAALIHSLVGYYGFHSGFSELLAAGNSPNEIYGLISEIVGKWNSGIDITAVYPASQVTMVEAYATPAVGASGAIYGVLVAFGLLYPNHKLMLIFLPIPIAAKYFIPVLLLLDLFSGLTGYSLMGANIANWAHLGGALFGFIMAYYWKKNDKSNLRWD